MRRFRGGKPPKPHDREGSSSSSSSYTNNDTISPTNDSDGDENKKTTKMMSRLKISPEETKNVYSKKKKFEEEEDEKKRASERIRKSIERGSAAGLLLKGGVNVFQILRKLAFSNKKSELRRTKALAIDALRFSAFVGSFSGTYAFLDEYIARQFGANETKKYRAFVSGALAAPTFLIAGDTPNYSLASYLSLKALILLGRVGANSSNDVVRKVFRVTKWEYADVMVVTTSAVVILGCYVLKPEAVRGAYGQFLDRHCGKTRTQVEALRELCFLPENINAEDADDLFREYCKKTAIKLNKTGTLSPQKRDEVLRNVAKTTTTTSRDEIYRTFFMNDASSIAHFITFVKDSWGTSFVSHIPIYVLPAILLHREKLLKDPKLLAKLFVGIARSSLFLTVYCALAWQGVYATGKLFKTITPKTLISGVPLAGIATFIEKKSRRGELATYCLDKSLESIVISMLSWGWIPNKAKTKRFDVVLFAFAAGVICMCYDQKRDSFRSNYLNVFDYVFGNRGHSRHKIRHVGSYEILFMKPSVVDLDSLASVALKNVHDDGEEVHRSSTKIA